MSAMSRDMTVMRSVLGALLGLVLASLVLSFVLSFVARQNFVKNLPLALVVVWATHVLAGVRFDLRWDTRIPRFHVSLTRQKPGDTPGTRVDGKGTTLYNAFSNCTEKLDSNANEDTTADATSSVTETSSEFPSHTLSKKETELRELLGRFETYGTDDNEKDENGDVDARSQNNPSPSGNAIPNPSSPGLLGTWSSLRDKIVTEFVVKLWYAPLTSDTQFPHHVSRVLDIAFAELAHRTRNVNLAHLCLETIPKIVANELERFREAKRTMVSDSGVDNYVRLTPKETDKAMAGFLLKELIEELSEASPDSIPKDPLQMLEKYASHKLSKRCEGITTALLSETGDSTKTNLLLHPLAREMLVGYLLKPLLGFFSPTWAHRGLNLMLAAEDDIAAAKEKTNETSAPLTHVQPVTDTLTATPGSPHRRSQSSLHAFRGTDENKNETVESIGHSRSSSMYVSDDEEPSTSSGDIFGADFNSISVRVTEAHIAGKGASAYAVYTVRVTVASDAVTGDSTTDNQKREWVVPRRFRNFEALHRRCEKEGVEGKKKNSIISVEGGIDSIPDELKAYGKTTAKTPDSTPIQLPSLPKKRYVLNSLDGAFLEARRALLDEYLSELIGEKNRLTTFKSIRSFLDPGTVTGVFAPEPEKSSVASLAAAAESAMSSMNPLTLGGTSGVNANYSGDVQKETRVVGKPPAGPKPPSPSGHNLAQDQPLSEQTLQKGHRKDKSTASAVIGGVIGQSAWSSSGDLTSLNLSDEDLNSQNSSISMTGGVLTLFESVFHLSAKGVVRRTFVAVARQTLEFFVGSAIEDLVAQKLRIVRSPATVTSVVRWIEKMLWPNGTWYKHVGFVDESDANGNILSTAEKRQLLEKRQRELEQKQLVEDERVRLKVRDALLASWSCGPLNNLVGDRNCTRAALDVLGAARSEILCTQIGLHVLNATLDALFPESVEGTGGSL